MTEGDTARLIAWGLELRTVHQRLRQTLEATRSVLQDGELEDADGVGRDLLLFCHGFCTALTAHHESEDHELFPAAAAAHPDIREALARLAQDHRMITGLVDDLLLATGRAAPPTELGRHLDGIAAIMESHFRYEERVLLQLLDSAKA